MSIGDVNSAERGSGARFNDGTIDLTLLPPWCWAEYAERVDDDGTFQLFYGSELEALISFWSGDDDAIHLVLDGLTDDDYQLAAEVFAYGARKYAAWNWAKGMPWSVPVACYLRHMLTADPDLEDGESGISHRGHAVCNLIMLAQFAQLCPDMDDRPQEIRPEWHAASERAQGLTDVPEVRLGNPFIRDVTGPDCFDVTYWTDSGAMITEELLNLPTSVLNNLVELSVEEQESRERTLRATGELRWNY